jgi:hypothetical protein
MSCFTFARVDPDSLKVTLMYNTNGGPKWAEGDLECLAPFDVLADQAALVDDVVTLVSDPTKVQAKLDQAWSQLRTERNRRLAASDWTQLVDSHLSQEKKDAWAAYRQELRDLPDELANTVPEGAGPPDLFEWPPVPGSVPVAPVTGSRLSNLLGGV